MRLPFELPSSMKEVEAQDPALPDDTRARCIRWAPADLGGPPEGSRCAKLGRDARRDARGETSGPGPREVDSYFRLV